MYAIDNVKNKIEKKSRVDDVAIFVQNNEQCATSTTKNVAGLI